MLAELSANAFTMRLERAKINRFMYCTAANEGNPNLACENAPRDGMMLLVVLHKVC